MDSGTRSTSRARPAHWRGRRSPSPRVGLTPSVADRRAHATAQIAGAAGAPRDAVADQHRRARRPAGRAPRPPSTHAHAAVRASRSTTTRPQQAAYEDAQQRADAAAAAAAQATADLGVARDEIVAFARRSYMQGSTYSGAAALITAADPGELIQRAALLEAAGGHRSDVLDRVTVLQQQATARRGGRPHRPGRGRPRSRSRRPRRSPVAQDAEISARAQAAGARRPAGPARRPSWPRPSSSCTALVGARAAAAAARRRGRRRAAPEPAGRAPGADRQRRPAAGSGSASAAQTAIDAAMGYLGTPYAWGGGGTRGPGPGLAPDEGVIGFDCSGLTQYAYAQAGISIPRNSRGAVRRRCRRSSERRPAAGTWCSGRPTRPTRDSIDHVAIYLGGGKVVAGAARAATSSRCRTCGGAATWGRSAPAPDASRPAADVEASGSHGGSCPTRAG